MKMCNALAHRFMHAPRSSSIRRGPKPNHPPLDFTTLFSSDLRSHTVVTLPSILCGSRTHLLVSSGSSWWDLALLSQDRARKAAARSGGGSRSFRPSQIRPTRHKQATFALEGAHFYGFARRKEDASWDERRLTDRRTQRRVVWILWSKRTSSNASQTPPGVEGKTKEDKEWRTKTCGTLIPRNTVLDHAAAASAATSTA